jgi:hypothetical protein
MPVNVALAHDWIKVRRFNPAIVSHCGVGTATLLRWQKLPEFQAALRRARRDAYSQSIARLQQASSAAVSTLLKTMIDASTPPATKVRAADSVLGHAAKAIEIEDNQSRVSALERAIEVSQKTR